jgi:DHA1 family multidrug resistance protein-like MFS transporter
VANKSVKSAASALAGNTFLRSLCGAGFPLFASKLFTGLGINWAATLLGCIAAVLVPIPVLFYVYGARIRAKSSFAKTLDLYDDGSSYEADSAVEDEKRSEGAGGMFERRKEEV